MWGAVSHGPRWKVPELLQYWQKMLFVHCSITQLGMWLLPMGHSMYLLRLWSNSKFSYVSEML